jgi:hypothetical protein
VWVIIKQATQADNIRLNDLPGSRELKYGADRTGAINSFSRIYNENVLRRRMEEVRLTLVDIGNFTDDGKPYFSKLPARDVPQKEFEDLWGKLPDKRIADAIHAAVLSVNVDWENPGE